MTRASADEINWICAHGHEWPAVVYSGTLSFSNCPECDALARPERAKEVVRKRREKADERAEAQLAAKASEEVADLAF